MASSKNTKQTAQELFCKVKSLQHEATNFPWTADSHGELYAPHNGPMRVVVPVATMAPADAAITAALTRYFVAAETELAEFNTQLYSLEDALLLLCYGMKRPFDVEEMGCTEEEAETVWNLYKTIAHKRGYTLHEDRLK